MKVGGGLALAALLVCGIPACSTLQPLVDSRAYLASQRPGRLLVTPRDGSAIVVTAPRLLGDTLVGFVDGAYRELLLSDVREVRVRQPAGGRTALLVAGVVATGAALIALLAATGPEGRLPTPEDPATSVRP